MKRFIKVLSVFFLLAGISMSLCSSEQERKLQLRTEIVLVKYINANWVVGSILRNYVSREGKINQIPGDNRLVIEDYPEVVDKILSILKELDVKPLDLQFTTDLILASLSPSAALYDEELKSDPLIKELTSILKYKRFKRLDSSMIKVQDNERSYFTTGGEGLSLKLELVPRYIKEEKEESFQVKLGLSQYHGLTAEGKDRITTLINTTLTFKSGERTVVGVSKLDGGDRALILIISGKVIK